MKHHVPFEHVDTLVYEGGGVKGYAYLGAMQVLAEHCQARGTTVQEQIRHHVGNSAGAITAALLAIGYSVEELTDMMGGLSFEDFKDDRFGVLRDIYNLIYKGGWCPGDSFLAWLTECLVAKGHDPDLTYGQLHALAQTDHRYASLYTVAVNLTRDVLEEFSHRSRWANVPIRYGVRASMAIPLFFEPVHIQALGTDGAEEFVDGGLLSNYPVWLFDHDGLVQSGKAERTTLEVATQLPSLNERLDRSNSCVLGLRLDNSREISRISGFLPSMQDTGGFVTRLKRLFTCLMQQQDVLAQAEKYRSVLIDTHDVGAVDFSMSEATKERLSHSGRIAMAAYLKGMACEQACEQECGEEEAGPDKTVLLRHHERHHNTTMVSQSTQTEDSDLDEAKPSKCSLM